MATPAPRGAKSKSERSSASARGERTLGSLHVAAAPPHQRGSAPCRILRNRQAGSACRSPTKGAFRSADLRARTATQTPGADALPQTPSAHGRVGVESPAGRDPGRSGGLAIRTTGPRRRAVGTILPLVLVALIASPGLASAANGDNITATERVSFTKRVADIDNCVFHDATIDWGDGSSSAGQFDTGTTPGVKGTHTYAEEGTFNGSVTYNTDCTTNAKVTFTATVADVGLSATGRDISATAGQSFTGVVSHFTDSDPHGTASDYSAQIDWGDGSSSAGTVSASSAGGFDVTGTHTYHSTGQAAVNVTIKDV